MTRRIFLVPISSFEPFLKVKDAGCLKSVRRLLFYKKSGGSGAASFAEIYYSIPSGKCSLYLRKKVGWLISRRAAAL